MAENGKRIAVFALALVLALALCAGVRASADGGYTVEFTYNNLEYVLPGGTSVPLSEILAALGLPGEAAAAEASSGSLFSASDETGEWTVTAHQAFSTNSR